MKPLDWLRTKTQQRKPTGGIVRIKDTPPIVLPTSPLAPTPAEVSLTIDNRQGTFTTPGEAALVMPTFAVQIDCELTKAEAEQIRQRFQTALKPRIPASARMPSADSNCDCWPQYIDCCCDVRKHAQCQ